MNTDINAIIIDGKVYEAVKGECQDCALRMQCREEDVFNEFCNFFEGYNIRNAHNFRYSQSLTDKLNNQ